jgi:hypothetical protein
LRLQRRTLIGGANRSAQTGRQGRNFKVGGFIRDLPERRNRRPQAGVEKGEDKRPQNKEHRGSAQHKKRL